MLRSRRCALLRWPRPCNRPLMQRRSTCAQPSLLSGRRPFISFNRICRAPTGWRALLLRALSGLRQEGSWQAAVSFTHPGRHCRGWPKRPGRQRRPTSRMPGHAMSCQALQAARSNLSSQPRPPHQHRWRLPPSARRRCQPVRRVLPLSLPRNRWPRHRSGSVRRLARAATRRRRRRHHLNPKRSRLRRAALDCRQAWSKDQWE